MAVLNLKIVVLDTHDVESICVADASTYPNEPPEVNNPILLVTPPGFNPISLVFPVQGNLIMTSDEIGISEAGVIEPLPDGLYTFSYSFEPSYSNVTTITIMRVNRLQEKFDRVFMTLDMMVCDQAIKTQAKVNLNTIYLLIQGSIAAANECAIIEANKLYDIASAMLDTMLNKNCGCTGNQFIIKYN
jgi:hypothetical protein